MDWNAILLPSTPVLELIARGSIIFLALTLLFRLVGQREAGGLGMTDLLVVVLVAEAAGAGMTGQAESTADGLVLTATMLFWSVALDAAAYRWPSAARIIRARPRPLIQDGRFNHRLMRREFTSEEELRTQLRMRGISDPVSVHRAYLEPNGMISVLLKEDTQT